MKTIYYSRHGLTEMNAAGLRCGSIESPLAADGETQAIKAGQAAKSLHIDTIVCSSMQRAQKTAEIIAEQIGYNPSKIIATELLKERHFGVLEGKPYIPDEDTDNIQGIEKEAQFKERLEKALAFIESQPGETILVVAHGAVGRMLRHVIDPKIGFRSSAGRFANAQITKLR